MKRGNVEQKIKDLEELTIGLQYRLAQCEHRLNVIRGQDLNATLDSIRNRLTNIEYAYSKEKQEATHLSGGVSDGMKYPFGYEPDPEPEVNVRLQEMVDDAVLKLHKDVIALEMVLRECYGLNQQVNTDAALKYVHSFRQAQNDIVMGEGKR